MSTKKQKFDTYIYRVLKQVHHDGGMSGDGLVAMNNIVTIIVRNIMDKVNRLMLSVKRKTISVNEIESAVKLYMPGELEKHSLSEGNKAVKKYVSAKEAHKNSKKKGNSVVTSSRAAMAGLIFPIIRIENIMMSFSISERKSELAAVFLTAVVEYICAEVLELAGNSAKDNKKQRITPRHIMMAVRSDSELSKLFANTIFSGGVVPSYSPKK